MLNQLREVYDHTGKLKQMLLDIDTVKELDGRFEKWQIIHGSGLKRVKLDDDALAVTSSFKVLSAANWPLKPPNTNFILPTVISQVHDEFNNFYQDQHLGRKLLWHWQLCYGEMRIHLKKGPAKGYILHASAYQIAILLLFNEKDELSYEDIRASTELESEILDTLLSVFLKIKLLKSEERDSTKLYTVNDSFTSKKVKIDIRVSLKKQKTAEMGETHRKIKEERKLLMQVSTYLALSKKLRHLLIKQATIVRIMKSRRKMTYQMLAIEVIRQLQARFAPKDPDIKRCVDLLIDKEFLERLDGGFLGYLA